MRYDDRPLLVNRNNAIYREQFFNRGVQHIIQYISPELRYPTPYEISQLQLEGHVWTLGDRYYKLAHEYYGSSRFWFVIAWFNQAPTESHLEAGQLIRIPLPLERILDYFDI